MNSICKFMPVKDYGGNIKAVNFVFEAEFKKLPQPFFNPIHRIHLITKGSAILKICNNEFELRQGCLFIAFPGVFYEIDGSEDFEYMFISFMGNSVQTLFEDLNLKSDNPVFYDFDHITEFWFESIRRINPSNSNILPESVLLYTLSYLSDVSDNVYAKADSEFNVIVEYVNTHFTDPEISLKQIAGIFSYTQKYLSFLFKKMMNVGFNEYVNHLRIQHSLQLIDQKMTSITQISELCGFSDPLYFSKVFKKKIEVSPANYIRQKNNN